MNLRTVRSLLFVIAGWLLLISGSARGAATGTVEVTKVQLNAGGSSVSAELFEQTPAAKRPVVIVLHGAGGMLFDGPEMRRVAAQLAADGNAAYVLHYFERTGTFFARDATMQKNFATWLATVRGAIDAVAATRGGGQRIGVYGYSLGGFLALLAGSDNPRVSAVVEHAGGIWNGKFDRVGRMPPVLMVHGRQDARVPFEKYAAPLVPLLRKRAASLETFFFPAEGHVFTPEAMGKVRTRASAFFRAHLRSS